jgi:hypothetical protein
MIRKICIYTTMLLFLNYALACSVSREVQIDPQNHLSYNQMKIESITLHSGRTIIFDPSGGYYNVERQMFWGLSVEGENLEIELDDVQSFSITTSKINDRYITLAVIGALISTLILLIIYLQINSLGNIKVM